MSTYPHIFTPDNESLEARVKAFKEVLFAYMNARASMQYSNQEEINQSLGSAEEIEYALNTTSDSLDLAFKSFDESELDRIQKEGLLDKSELLEVVQLQRKNEINNKRQEQDSTQASNQQK